jgi:hypothetical protein
MTGGLGVDAAFDAIGSEQTALQVIEAVAPGGRAVPVRRDQRRLCADASRRGRAERNRLRVRERRAASKIVRRDQLEHQRV